MKIISHRGNLEGPKSAIENYPEAINFAISQGFECEIDLWSTAKNQLFLGHDSAEYFVDLDWILEKSRSLWIHCKNFSALSHLLSIKTDLNFFWHQEDDHVLTSKKYIWSYPGRKVDKNSIGVLPECWDKAQLADLNSCLGVCTDFPRKFDLELNGSTLR